MTESASAESASIETRAEAERAGEAKFWQGQLSLSDKDHKDWIKDGKGVVERYRGGKQQATRSNAKQSKFNILYSNTETLKAALFVRMAKPDIRRRFSDADPIGRQVAEIVERATIYTQESEDSERAYEHGIEDYLLPGRGVVRVCYEAETATGPDGKEYVADQELYDEYVAWDDYRHEPARTWDLVTWEAFRHKMSRDDLTENFGEAEEGDGALTPEVISSIPLNWSPDASDNKTPDAYKRAEVWEIFDKQTRTRIWVVPGFDTVLRKDADPYGLEGFFPNAEPLQAVTTNESLIPTPEFDLYRDQADALDEIEARIDKLTRALKRRGVYDATFKELVRLSKGSDNEFIPVKNYAEFSQKGGLAAAFQSEDLAALANVLRELQAQREQRVQTIYEIVGIADIMRGSSDPRETLGAQKIKAQFGGNRLKKRQDKVQKWIRDTLRIKSEIIAEHFEPQKLADMTGFKWMDPAALAQREQAIAQAQAAQMAPQPGAVPGMPAPAQPAAPVPMPPPLDLNTVITPEMIAILRNDKLRSYRIDIETDSTIFEDAEQEKQAATEMLKAASEFVLAWLPAIQAQPALLEMAFEMLAFALRRFKSGRTLEDVIEQTKTKLKSAAAQPKPPDPKAEAEAIKAKGDKDQAAADAQFAERKHMMRMEELNAEGKNMAFEIELERLRGAVKGQAVMADAATTAMEAAMQPQPVAPAFA